MPNFGGRWDGSYGAEVRVKLSPRVVFGSLNAPTAHPHEPDIALNTPVMYLKVSLFTGNRPW